MSFYRSVLVAVAALALAAPVFADDTNNQTSNNEAMQVAEANTDTQQTTTTTTTDQTSATTTETKVNINKATAKELMAVKGINAAKARSIVAYRKKHGDFTSFDQLTAVKGFKKVKPEMLKNIEDQLTLE